MTAAHCLRNHNSNYQVLLGQSHLNSETFGKYRQLVSISRVEQHPKYDNTSGYFDVGLIHTAEPIEFTEAVKPLCLPPKSFQITSGLSTKLAGWGQTQKNNVRTELTLRHIYLTLFDKNYCYEKYEITGGDAGKKRQKFLPDMFTDQVICAGSDVSSSFSVFPREGS